MATRDVVLNDPQASLVEHPVSSGRYQSAREVLREALWLVERHKSEDERRFIDLRESAPMGINDIEAGAFHTFDSAALTSEVMDA